MRIYPPEVKEVTVRTDGAAGSDLDLLVVQCSDQAPSPADDSCRVKDTSAGGTAAERVAFEPEAGSSYAVIVDGYSVQGGEAEYENSERLLLHSGPEKFGVQTSKLDLTSFQVQYQFMTDQVSQSFLAQSPLFKEGQWVIEGALKLKNSDDLLLDSIPVKVRHATQSDMK
jgi:hypothetical protein